MQQNINEKAIVKTIELILIFALICLPTMAQAVTADQMLANINAQLPYLYKIVTGFGYLAGVFFVIVGVHKLKEFGNSAMQSGKLAMKEPFAYIIVGAMLIYFPSTLGVFLTTVYGTSSITPYIGYGAPGNTFNEIGATIVGIVQFVGLVSFVRGLMMLHKVGVGESQQGASFNKGLTHLIGGIIAMNIVQFGHIISSTLGVSS
ncbi:MAG: hypothetical protein HKM04_03540 [Legionellales bacterium]|nr:hypothetical protein [Legionellales bacterium]